MGVKILLDGPHRSAGRRLGRALAVTGALPLIIVGIVGLIGLGFSGALLATGSIHEPDQSRATLFATGCALAGIVALWSGLRLLRGHRQIALFLRRFGYVDATRAVTFATTTALGGSWRLVTFDDEMAKGVGGQSTPRRASGLGMLLVLGGVAALALWFVPGGGGDDVYGSLLAGAEVSSDSGGSGALDEVGRTLAAGVFLGLLVFVVGILVLVGTGVSLSALLFSYVRARRAEHAKTDRIRSDREVTRRVSAIARRGSRILAPRLVVVTVAHAVWQRAVHSFAHSAAVVIIDVSIPSDSLRWEITTLLPVLGRRCVLVGQLDQLARESPDGRTVLASPLARDIDGQEILAYRSDRKGLRRFASALRGTIEARVAE